MVSEAHANSFDIILSEDLDRLSRSQSDIAQLYEDMNFAEVEIHTLADGLINEMHVGVKGTMAALFLKGLAQKVRRGLGGVVRQGRNPGGDLYGYTPRKGEPGLLDINPETSAVVKRIFEEYVAGASPRVIAAALNADNIPAPRGGKRNASTINGNTARGQGLLLNERFVGRVVWNKRRSVKDPKTGRRITRTNPESEWVTQDVPGLRILDDNLFEAARARRLGLVPLHRVESQNPSGCCLVFFGVVLAGLEWQCLAQIGWGRGCGAAATGKAVRATTRRDTISKRLSGLYSIDSRSKSTIRHSWGSSSKLILLNGEHCQPTPAVTR
ncbi:hypothetical protein ABIC08_002766 [Bradyrhizobium sp. RT9b]